MPKKPKPKIEEVAQEFGKAHAEENDAKKRKDKYRLLFFDLIEIPEDQLSRQTIYAECDNPEAYVASLYPKWRIISKKLVDEEIPDEWRLVIQEDPAKRNFVFVNPLDNKVYTRTVAESAPQVDLDRLKEDDPDLYESMTFQPDPPPRQLKPLNSLDDDEKETVKRYLLPVKLQNRMEKPRDPKPEELDQ